MTIFKSEQKKFECDFYKKIGGKNYILLKVLNTSVLKFMQILVGSIMLMVFPLKWIEPILFFSKWENTLVLKY